MGGINFWYETGGQLGELIDLRANAQAIKDVLQLKYLDGGGHGCNYPDDRFSMIRRWLHHCVFYGSLLCFASTAIAAIYDYFLHLSVPYPILSWPVMLGTVGGLVWFEMRSNNRAAGVNSNKSLKLFAKFLRSDRLVIACPDSPMPKQKPR